MKYIYLLSVVFYVRVSSTLNTAVTNRKQLTSHCENANRNSLIEHFFNVIFSEFYATPPVCVCVQMCAGESTYCYPNGCLKGASNIREERDEANKKPEPQSSTQSQGLGNKQFMLVADEKFDFMTDFLERNYVDDSKIVTQKVTPLQDLRPDPFKDKYSLVGKLKRLPKVELRYNIRDQVKNSKSDIIKTEGVDLTKTRWPMKQQRSGHKLFSEDSPSGIGKINFFGKMLADSNVAEYPPKYFKRDLTKTTTGEDDEGKAFYAFENTMNRTDGSNFSLESLIDILIKSSFTTNVDPTQITKEDESEVESKAAIENVVSVVSSTSLPNEAPKVISMNFTNENVEKNKYAEDSTKLNKTRKLNDMITYLEKQIDKQNNTSMEIAQRVVGEYEETTTSSSNIILKNYSVESIDNSNLTTEESTDSSKYLETETSTPKEIQVTRKNRQRFVRKLSSGKFN